MRELVRQAARAVFRWTRVRTDSVQVRVKRSAPNLRPQTYWDAALLCINILSLLRLFISSYPQSDVVVTPGILRDIIYVKLNDIVVIGLWLLFPAICVRSFLSQLRAKSKEASFQVLFYESLFGNESQIFNSYVPFLTLQLTPLSLWYIWTLVVYTYAHWTVELVHILHAVQLYPRILMLLQSLFQGFYLLWMFTLITFRESHRKKPSFQSDLREYIYLNIAFLVHCICLTVIADKNDPILYLFAIGEAFYRLLAVFSFLYLLFQATAQSTLPSTPSTTDPSTVTSRSLNCKIAADSSSSEHVCALPISSFNQHSQMSSLDHQRPPPPPPPPPPGPPEKSFAQTHRIELYQLQCLDCGRGPHIRVMDRMSANWTDVAVALHFDGNTIESIQRDASHEVKPACRIMFQKWLAGEGKRPASWTVLIKALEDALFKELAKELRKALQ